MATVREESKLKRNIGFWPLMGIAYGQIIGAGIMTMTGIAIGMTGTGVALAYVISAICTLFRTYPTAILGACVPTTGGDYRYISRLHGKKLGFVFLATYLVQNLTIALYALSCASYLVKFLTGVSQNVIAIALLLVAYCINLVGNKQSALVTTGITFALLIGLTMFIVFGLPKADVPFVLNPANIFVNGPVPFLSALALLSFATGGAQVISNMGGEIIEPQKNIPRVMVLSTLSVGVLYGLIALVASGVLPLEQVMNQNLSLVAEAVMPRWAFVFFTLAAGGGATAKTLNVTLSWVSKPILVACEDGMLPKSLGTVSSRGVPTKILTMFLIIGLTPIALGVDIGIISKMGTAIGLVSSVIFSYAFMQLPKKYPKQYDESPLKVSSMGIKIFGWGSAVLSALFSSVLLKDLPTNALIGFGILMAVTIIVAYFTPFLDKVNIPDDLAVDYQEGPQS